MTNEKRSDKRCKREKSFPPFQGEGQGGDGDRLDALLPPSPLHLPLKALLSQRYSKRTSWLDDWLGLSCATDNVSSCSRGVRSNMVRLRICRSS